MKKILLLTVAMVVLMASGAWAGGWSIHCENGSCEASAGRLKVFWQANNMNGDIYRGQITGVEGIPVSIEDFQSAEKKIESAFEKSIVRKKTNTNEVNAKSPEETGGGPGAGTSSTGERAFTQKQTQTQEKVIGRKVNIDYTLQFVKWLGDTRFSHAGPGDIGKYWAAAEYSMQAYMEGTLQAEIEGFFFQKNAGQVDNVPVNAKLNDDNREIVLTKFYGLTRYGANDDTDVRYGKAHGDVIKLLYNKAYAPDLEKVSIEYETYMKELTAMTEGGQTALKLYEANKKDLALAKWVAETRESFKKYSTTQDKYISALAAVHNTPADDPARIKAMADFEAAIKAKDPSVQIVSFKGPVFPMPVVFGLIALVAVGCGVIFIAKKKAKKKEAGE